MGGCAGSTAGAMKVIRVQLFFKQAFRGFFHTVHPSAVAPPCYGGRPVTLDMMRLVSAFIGLYVFTLVIATAGMSLTGMDFTTARSAPSTTTIERIRPSSCSSPSVCSQGDWS